MRDIRIFTPKKQKPDISERIKEIIGKKVLGKNGEVVGKVKDIVMHEETIEGIIVSKGITKYFLDYQYIEDLYADSVLLNINPAMRYIKMQVFDAQGKKLGKVVDITQKDATNLIESIVVKKNLFSKHRIVPTKDIEVSDKNIILKSNYD